MIIDFKKETFNNEEVDYFKKSILQYNKNTHIPIIVILDSKVLTIEMNKFIFPKNKNLESFENIIRMKINNLSEYDELQFKINGVLLNKSCTIEYLYACYRNEQLNCLIITVNKNGYIRYVKDLLFKIF